MIEKNPPETAKFVTHLPVFDLLLVSEWGPNAYEHVVDELGWVRVQDSGPPLPPRWFVSRIEGHGIDDGANGFHDGALAVFEFELRGPVPGVPYLIRGSFADPELGAYTVRLIWRRGDGRMVLMSLNPDRSRFPDIVVDTGRADGVRVVARLVRPLSAT